MKVSEIIRNISTIIFFANIFLAFVIIFLSRKNSSTTWAWVLVLMFIPVLGFILYLFLGRMPGGLKSLQKADEDKRKLKVHIQELLSRESSDINHPAIEGMEI